MVYGILVNLLHATSFVKLQIYRDYVNDKHLGSHNPVLCHDHLHNDLTVQQRSDVCSCEARRNVTIQAS